MAHKGGCCSTGALRLSPSRGPAARASTSAAAAAAGTQSAMTGHRSRLCCSNTGSPTPPAPLSSLQTRAWRLCWQMQVGACDRMGKSARRYTAALPVQLESCCRWRCCCHCCCRCCCCCRRCCWCCLVLLAQTGFDVWLGNTRGTPYSRRTVNGLSPDQASYWAFSINALALVDLPAQVDYVLQATGASKIGFLGHSQVGLLLGAAAVCADAAA